MNVADDLDEDAFFAMDDSASTAVSRYDLEKAVLTERNLHFEEVERYW